MLQLDNYIIDFTHTSYKRKNTIGKKIIYNNLQNNSNREKFQNPNKTRQETRK